MSRTPLVPILLALVAVQTVILVGWSLPTANADEPAAVPFRDPPRLYCRPFQVPLEGAASAIETNDTTTEIGQWIAREEQSYDLFSIDFEIGQKRTGFPVAYAHVCLSPRRD